MTKQFNIEEAASWSVKETEENLKYLEARVRWADIQRVKELRDSSPTTVNYSDVGDEGWFANATAQEIHDWVGDDKERAQRALDEEKEREEPRKGLTQFLEKVLAA